ncbi:MAG: hypothetical protein NC222_06395 [Staphylococcus sp.]|nr:hypothetical protein [Staphylococcus sp.]
MWTKLVKAKNLTKTERYNKNLEDIFNQKKDTDNKMAEYLIGLGVDKNEVEKLKQDDKLSEKLWELGKNEEFFNSIKKSASIDFDSLYETLLNGNITEYKQKLRSMSRSDIDQYLFWADELDIDRNKLNLHYVFSSKKQAGESGGWYVAPHEAREKLDLWIESVGETQALWDVVTTMSTDELSSALVYIFRMNNFEEGQSKQTEE